MFFDEPTLVGDAAICGEIWRGDGGFGLLERLVDQCKGRFAGTENERRAADILLETFRGYGLRGVHEEPFEYDGWRRGAPASLLLSAANESIYTFSLPGSPAAQVEGEFIDLSCATDDDLAAAGNRLKGAIALISAATPHGGKPMHRNEKVARAARHGAVAILWMRDEPGQLAETGSLFFQDAPRIPGLAVTREDGLRLARWARRGDRILLKVATDDSSLRLTSWNLVGDIPGSAHPEEQIIIAAHYDGHDIAEGANDNGSGIAAIAEAARVLARHQGSLQRTIRFIAVGVEELGLFGAHAYARDHSREFDTLRFMFNLDTIASPGAAKGVAIQRRPELRGPLQALGEAMGENFQIDDQLSMYSDQFPFVLQGAPSGLLTSPDSPRLSGRGVGHTTADTLDKVDRLSLKLSALFTARLTLFIANAPEWPARRWSSEETRQEMERAGVRATMEMEGTWPSAWRQAT